MNAWPADAGEGFLTVAGKRLECVRHPAAREGLPTLVFLHEGLGSVSLWRDFPGRLAAATGCGALVYSRPGYGRSGPADAWGADFMHREARETLPAVLAAAGVERAVLVGHSDGASIALVHAAEDRSGRVAALALEAPHVFVEDVTTASIARLAAEARDGGLAERLRRHHGASTDALLAAWTGVWLSPAFRAWDLTPLLPSVRVPVLVVQGEDDEYGTAAQVDAVVRGVSGPAESLLLPRCGHAPHRDRPEETLAAMARFAARLDGERKG